MNSMRIVFASAIIACVLPGSSYSAQSDSAEIRAELTQMADDFLNYREMQGFDHEMDLTEA